MALRDEWEALIDSTEVKLEDLFKGPDNISDVGLEPSSNPYPNARHDLTCGDCGGKMQLIVTAKYKRPFYSCLKYPDCKGTMGAMKDGRPLGTPTDVEGREARKKAHEVFDEVWKSGIKRRGEAYAWMQEAMNLGPTEAHIAMFTKEQCEQLIRLVNEAFPQT